MGFSPRDSWIIGQRPPVCSINLSVIVVGWAGQTSVLSAWSVAFQSQGTRRKVHKVNACDIQKAYTKRMQRIVHPWSIGGITEHTRNNGSKRHSLHAVELSQRSGKPCINCVDPSRPQQWGPDYRLLGKPAMRTRWMAGNAPHKRGRCRD